jgi:hypothetical protein
VKNDKPQLSFAEVYYCVRCTQEVRTHTAEKGDRKFERPSSSCNGWPGPARSRRIGPDHFLFSFFHYVEITPLATITVAAQPKNVVRLFWLFLFLPMCVWVSKFLIPPCTQTHAAAVLIYIFVELFGWERKSRSIDRCEQSELRVFYFFPYSSERIEFELPPNHVPRSGCPSVDLTQRTEKWISTRPENNENRNWFVRSNFFFVDELAFPCVFERDHVIGHSQTRTHTPKFWTGRDTINSIVWPDKDIFGKRDYKILTQRKYSSFLHFW